MQGELIFSVMLLLGLFTRFTALSLIVIVVVAIISVHWPSQWALSVIYGKAISTTHGYGNYKLPLLFIIMLLSLMFSGGGRNSLDQLLLKLTKRDDSNHPSDMILTIGCGALALAICTIHFFPPSTFFWLEYR